MSHRSRVLHLSHLKSGFLLIILDTAGLRVKVKAIKRVVPGGIPLN